MFSLVCFVLLPGFKILTPEFDYTSSFLVTVTMEISQDSLLLNPLVFIIQALLCSSLCWVILIGFRIWPVVFAPLHSIRCQFSWMIFKLESLMDSSPLHHMKKAFYTVNVNLLTSSWECLTCFRKETWHPFWHQWPGPSLTIAGWTKKESVNFLPKM